MVEACCLLHLFSCVSCRFYEIVRGGKCRSLQLENPGLMVNMEIVQWRTKYCKSANNINMYIPKLGKTATKPDKVKIWLCELKSC
jgi:hypothetical protein